MNKLQVLIGAAIAFILAGADILETDKRPSVEDINKAIGDDNYKSTAADADAVWKSLTTDAELSAEGAANTEQVIDDLKKSEDHLKGELKKAGKAGGASTVVDEGEGVTVMLTKNVRFNGKLNPVNSAITLPQSVLDDIGDDAYTVIETAVADDEDA